MSTLHGTLQAHEVHDLEALVRKALDNELAHRGAHLDPAAYDDALAYLLADAWQLSQRYDPTRSRPNPHNGTQTNFATWAYRILRRRYTDWLRWSHHDARYGPEREPTLSLDLLFWDDEAAEDSDYGYSRPVRLADAVTSQQGDPQTDRSPDLQRLLNQGNSQDTRLLNQPGPGPTPRTSRRDR